MTDILIIVAVLLVCVSVLLSLLPFFRGSRLNLQITPEIVSRLMRDESEQIHKSGDDQARGLRQELGENLRGFQETTLRGFRDLGDRLEAQVKEFGTKLDGGIIAIHDRSAAIAVKLDQVIARMGEEASRNGDTLRQSIEVKLDDASTKQSTAAREFREEMTGSFRQLGASIAETLGTISEHQKERQKK